MSVIDKAASRARALWKRQQLQASYDTVFRQTGPAGQEVLKDLMTRGRMLDTSMQTTDPHLTAFNEGRRSIVLEILHMLRKRPEDLQALSMEILDARDDFRFDQ